jgi:hypothetical protein
MLHWNYQKHIYRSTFGPYIKELLVQKYWQLISTKQLWSVPNSVSFKSRTVQYWVPRCPGQYRNVQYRVPRCPSQYRNVQVPSCPGTEMSRIHHRSIYVEKRIDCFQYLQAYERIFQLDISTIKFSGMMMHLVN